MSTPLTNRKINLLQATSINMIDMVGIGPFVVMPFVVAQFDSGLFIWAWIFGAFTAFMDAMVWSELGAKYPLAGGTYNFHRIAFGEKGGKLMSFLFVWQTSIQAPLVVASAAIGFAQYLTYIVPLDFWQLKIVSGGLVILVFLLLYRKIETIGKISVIMGSIVVLTIIWIIISGLTNQQQSIKLLPTGSESFFTLAFWAAIGQASVKTVYAYLGYYNVCHLGGEIKNPGKNIPKSIFISIIGIATLYLLMNISVMGVMPWQSVKEGDRYLVSSFMEQLYDHQAGIIVTVLILCIAFSSLFAVVLGYSRVPYAAAVDGNFFKLFAKLHPTKNFPYISLIVLCALGFVFSLFMRLGDVISSILAMRIIVQFIGQGVGVVLLRKKFGTEGLPFKMWLFPVPIILSVAIWIFLFISTGWFALWGSFIAVVGVVVYSVKARLATNQNL
ncbi:MAG: APC family permease [Chitinophagaceae bacterium]|nr:amino acid permease [Chitinophagaceae bacterium]MBK8299640.1 amino acid permease [Chitinophagaceae bacterium]